MIRILIFSWTLLLSLCVNAAPGANPVLPSAGDFTSSVGLKFIKLPQTNPLFSVWLTRVRDYAVFSREEHLNVNKPDFPQTPDDPVVNVNWDDAIRFCQWLTERDHKKGIIEETSFYRLPTTSEWSQAAGILVTTRTDNESSLEKVIQQDYPWGNSWPPPKGVGNYSSDLNSDPYRYTSPVGSFPANKNGLFDMSGNVWEWCMDSFSHSDNLRVLRGGSWRIRTPVDLKLSTEIGNLTYLRLPSYGFRCVLDQAKESQSSTLKPEIPAEPTPSSAPSP